MIQATTGEAEARGNIRELEIRQLRDYLLRGQAGGKKFEDVHDPDAHPANAGASTTLLRIDGDAIHQLDRIAHGASL